MVHYSAVNEIPNSVIRMPHRLAKLALAIAAGVRLRRRRTAVPVSIPGLGRGCLGRDCRLDRRARPVAAAKSIAVASAPGVAVAIPWRAGRRRRNQGKGASGRSMLEGQWQLQMLFATDNKWTKVPYLSFNLSDSSFSGNSSCNSIRGKFMLADNFIGFDKRIVSTKMACPGSYEKTFLSALLSGNLDPRQFNFFSFSFLADRSIFAAHFQP